jgi:hypothetical protein
MRPAASLSFELALLAGLAPSVLSAGELFVIDHGKLHASDPLQGALFGTSVAIFADRAVIGAPRAAPAGGAAYVLVRDGDAWVEEAKLVPPDAPPSASFGQSVAIDGDRIVIGALTDDPGGLQNAGSAYVFVRDAGGWSFEAKIVDSDAEAGAEFGYAVAISGDTVLVGAVLDDFQGGLGSVSAFVRSGTSWIQQAKFRPVTSDGSAFGATLRLVGDTVLIGAPSHNPGGLPLMGAAYVYEHSGGAWSERALLVASDAEKDSNFGGSLWFSGTTALIGARGADLSGHFTNEGAVYVFEGAGSSWTETAKWIASDVQPQDGFGQAVALEGDVAIVGANWSDAFTTNVGAAYVFRRLGGVWTEQEKLLAPDGDSGDLFGAAVSIEGPYVLVGAYGDSIPGFTDAGTATAYELLDCAAAVQAVEVSRAGSPPNPDALKAGVSGPPLLGYVWEPIVDHTGFVHAPFGDWLVVAVAPHEEVTPYGTLLVDLAQPFLVFSTQAGQPFELAIPADCQLAGTQVHVQAAALGFVPALTNALDVVVGTP